MKLIALAVMAAALLAACGGDGEKDEPPPPVPEAGPASFPGEDTAILHRQGYDISMADFRAALRADMELDPTKWRLTCGFVADEPAPQAWLEIEGLNLFGSFYGPNDPVVLPAGATEVAGQVEVLSSGAIATQLMVEECAEAFPYYRR